MKSVIPAPKDRPKYRVSDFASSLSKRIKHPPKCPFCDHANFTVSDSFTQLIAQKAGDGIELGQSIPCAVVICNHCGYVALFALGTYGLIPGHEVNTNEQSE